MSKPMETAYGRLRDLCSGRAERLLCRVSAFEGQGGSCAVLPLLKDRAMSIQLLLLWQHKGDLAE
jgi:hypothetical protein